MDQRTTPSMVAASSATQAQLTEVEAAAEEFCEKILSVFKDYLPEPPLVQHTDTTVPESFNQPFGPLSEAEAAAEEFLKGTRHNHYRRLYIAASKGDWETAKSFIKDDPSALTARITSESLTTLIVAARAGQWKFVQKLLEDLPSESLVAQDVYGRTALHYVAKGGSLKTAKALIGKNSDLPSIVDSDGESPLFYASRKKKLFWYLLLVTMDKHSSLPFTPRQSAVVLHMLIVAGYYDITLYMLRRYPQLAIFKGRYNTSPVLYLLSSHFQKGQSNLRFWPKWIYKLIHVEVSVTPYSIFIDVEDIPSNAGVFPDMAALVQPSSILTLGLQINCLCGRYSHIY